MNERDHHDHSHHHSLATVQGDAMRAKDPVCGMTVKLDEGKPSRKHKGETYHFCSQKCYDKFGADPEHFLSGKHRDEALPEGTKYTCPMHPEIVRDEPGDCPICGMALEPMGVPAADEEPNPELVDFKRRFLIGAILTIPLLVLTMGPFVGLGAVREIFGERTTLWIELVLGTPVILWAGWPFFVRGVKSVSTAASTCSRSSAWASARRIYSAWSPSSRPRYSRPASAMRKATSGSTSRQAR